jgi:O-methyltransferase involved in polyketide biosynthesis
MPEKSYDKISPTAIDVAYARAMFTNMPFAREIFKLARKFADLPWYEKTPYWLLRLGVLFPRSVAQISDLEIRYFSTNTVIDSLDDSWAIVEVASGISARSLEWGDRRMLHVETDLPGMLEIKQFIFNEIVKNKGLTVNSNHFFMPLNALDPDAWNQVGETYFAGKDYKIAVINEGLLGYFTREEKAKMRDNIREFFKSYAVAGMWVSTDFTYRIDPNLTWIGRRVKKDTERKTERSFDYFDSHDEIAAFLQEGGFEVDFPPNDAIVDKLTCIPKMHLSRELIAPVLERNQACVAKYE